MDKQNLVKMIASRAASTDFLNFFSYLPNPDPVLKKMGRDITAYREILSDPHVGGCVRRRKAAVKSLEWRITTTGNEKVDNNLSQIFSYLPISKIISQALDASLFGYQPLEVMWEVKNGLFIPTSIIAKPPEWFVFDNENQLRFRTKADPINGIELPEKKFLLATQDASYTNPYGRADLALCFWAATFKKGGFKFWLEFTEKYGAPWLIGKYPRRSQHQEIDELMDAMQAMLGTAVAAIPDDSSIEIQESSSKGASSTVFQQFLSYCKAEIAIALLGQNQTTEAEANRASATAGLEVLTSIRDDDARMIEELFNELLQWICDFNFKNLPQLPQFELFEQEKIDKQQAERDEILSRIGVKFSKQYLQRTYDFEDGDLEVEDKATQSNSSSFAEKSSKPLDEINAQLEIETEPFIENWLQVAKDKISSASSLEEARELINSLIPDLEYSEYAKLMAMASVRANLQGQFDVVNEVK